MIAGGTGDLHRGTISEGSSGCFGRDDAASGGEAFQHIARQRGEDGVVFDATRLPAAITDPAPEAGCVCFDDRALARRGPEGAAQAAAYGQAGI